VLTPPPVVRWPAVPPSTNGENEKCQSNNTAPPVSTDYGRDTSPEERADFIRRHQREEWEWPDTGLVVRLAFEFADYDLPDDDEIEAIDAAART
jgi:hypothetical protein